MRKDLGSVGRIALRLLGRTSAWLVDSVARRSAASLAFALALLLAVPGVAVEAWAQARAKVADIKFEGNRRTDADTLRLSLRTKRGQPLDESLLNEDIKTLYDLFATVQVKRDQVGDEVVITFVVTENAIVTDLIVRGTSGLSESDVRLVIETAKGRPLADFRVENDKRKVERLYRMRGYHFVQVRTEVTDFSEGKRVTFDVLEGPSVQVEQITFKGNESLPRAKLLENMATQEAGFLGLRGAPFVEEVLSKDRGSLLNLYRREGFLNAEVLIEDVSWSEDRRKAFIVIAIREGPEFTVASVTIQGADSYPGGTEALRPLLRLEPGKRYRLEDLWRSIDAIQKAYREEGYFSVVVSPEEKPSGSTVALVLKVDEHSKVKVRNLQILGNEITQDRVIRREITIYPGDVLNQNEIDKSVNRLKSLGYFTRVAADVQSLAEGDDPNLRDVRFEVDDTAKTGQVRFAIGASSDFGLLGSLTVTKRNFDWRDWPERLSDVFSGRAFTGAGQTFQLELSPGQDYSSYRLAFTEPWLFDKPITFGWDLFFSKFTRFDYDVDRKGLDLSLGRRWTFEGKRVDTVFGLTGTTRIENVELSNLSSNSSSTAFLAEGSNSLVSERVEFRIERVDNRLNPTSGWFASFVPELGFAGDIQLFKSEIEAHHYTTLWTDEDSRKHTLAFGLHLGYARPLGGSVEADPNVFGTEFVPTYERFFAGGATSVRGFEFGGAGPHGHGNPFTARQPGETQGQRNVRLGNTVQSILENDGDPLGGDILMTANVEYTVPLYQDMLAGVLFIDTGMVRDSKDSSHGLNESEVIALRRQLNQGGKNQKALARQLEFNNGASFFDDIRVAIGFGLRIRIPGFGSAPIALDFGFPIHKQNGDDEQVLSFSIARDF